MVSRGVKGIFFSGRVDSYFLELCKIQFVNIVFIVDACMCNLIEKGNIGIRRM